jgi:hypothetical protein
MDGDLIMMVGFVLATDMVVVVGLGPAGAGPVGPVAAPEVVDVGADAPETYPRGTGGARPQCGGITTPLDLFIGGCAR